MEHMRYLSFIYFIRIFQPCLWMCCRREEVEKKLKERRRSMEDRGLKIGRKKTGYLRFNGDGNLDETSDINLHQ